MGVEAFIAEPPVEALMKPFPPAGLVGYSFSTGPAIDGFRAKLCAVVDRDRLRIAPQLGHPLQAFDHSRSRHIRGSFKL